MKNNKQTPIERGKSASMIASDDARGQLMEWAHKGDEESLKKLSDFIIKEKDADLREFARLAHDEAEFFFYSPRNDKEEQEFLLAKMVYERDMRLWELIGKADAAKFELQKLDLDRGVHRKVIDRVKEQKKTNTFEEWKYNFSEDYCKIVQNQLKKIEDEISYESSWLEQARTMITAKQYHQVPVEFWEHIHWDGEGSTFWADENDDECYSKECCDDAQY